MLLKRIVQVLNLSEIPFAVVGGYAVNLHGFIRSTIDLDLIIPLDKNVFIRIEKSMQEAGFSCRVPVRAEDLFDHLEQYRRDKNMIVWSFYDAKRPWDIVDYLLTDDLRNFRTNIKRFEEIDIPVIDIDGLIELKRSAGRPQDLEDIRALEASRGRT